MHEMACPIVIPCLLIYPGVLQEREAFIAEAVAERRRLADENAAASRAAEEARANLLDLKTRVAQYEAQASAALRQAHEEEAKATTAKEASAKERATLDDLKRELQVGKLKPLDGLVVRAVLLQARACSLPCMVLPFVPKMDYWLPCRESCVDLYNDIWWYGVLQVATSKLDEDRRQLQEWGGRLAALTRDFDEARQEVKAARTEIEGQRNLLTQQVGPVLAPPLHSRHP